MNAVIATRGAAGSVLILFCVFLAGCRSQPFSAKPSIEISDVPGASVGGPETVETIGGHVKHAKPGQQIVLYAHAGVWWVQPFADQPYTRIQPDATWRSSTHLGTEYAALLVDDGYRPASKLSVLPNEGNGVAAVVIVKGKTVPVAASAVIHFSGHDWAVRSASSDRGGEVNAYDPANAWTDDKGFLHLRMDERNGRWSCAEVSLTRSLGYGRYSFVVEDSAHLSPSAVLGIFTWDDSRSEGFRDELDIELSRWGDAHGKNAQYVIQPFYVPENQARFTVPPGVLTHTFDWQPSSVAFRTTRGASVGSGAVTIADRVFTANVPNPANETVHMDLYDFHHLENPPQPPSEIVIQAFEFAPGPA